MSTLMLTNEAYNSIFLTLAQIDRTSQEPKTFYHTHFRPLAEIYKAGTHLKGATVDIKFQRLVTMWAYKNHQAYMARYPDEYNEYFGYSTAKPTFKNGKVLSMVELVKKLNCIKYNLDNYQDKTLDQIIAALNSAIVDRLPEYNAAAWG